ncbi:MAG TPA: glycosyl hydrolase family 17 protein, partial [Burkholderiaceae bacterium]|nr:glycosyl hydrolase family 17 protein [Burkholderiaceae bacterium]
FPDKEILIGETGWPSAGRSREEARPGRVEQARFLREFVAMAQAERIPYNLIEAFDQPWKARLEGAMGAHWGVFDSAGEAKFPWQGPVVARPGWRAELAWSVVGALAFAGLGLVARGQAGIRGDFGRLPALLAQAFAGGATTLLLLAQWRYLQDWNRDPIEWAATLPFLMATAPLAWLAVSDMVTGNARALRTLDVLRMLFLFGAAVNIVLLVFDARYRGFPMAFFAVPAIVELLRLACSRLRPSAVSDEARLLAAIVAGGAVAVAVFEGPANREAMSYCALMLVYAFARIDFRLLRGSARAASTVPTADGS